MPRSHPRSDAQTRPIRWVRLVLSGVLAAVFLVLFCALGTWQLHRLHWKTDLIARVDARLAADPVPAPGPDSWASLSREADEYRRVTVRGRFLNDAEVQIYTPADFGPAYWVMTPLQRSDGSVVMINRGLVPQELKDPATRPAPEGIQRVSGLLRLSEDKAWLFNRDAVPEERLWYRRDIASITRALQLDPAAPYFIDQDASQDASGGQDWPLGGQTVVAFRNSHLSYLLTWYGLAIMVAGGFALVLRAELRRARGLDDDDEEEEQSRRD